MRFCLKIRGEITLNDDRVSYPHFLKKIEIVECDIMTKHQAIISFLYLRFAHDVLRSFIDAENVTTTASRFL